MSGLQNGRKRAGVVLPLPERQHRLAAAWPEQHLLDTPLCIPVEVITEQVTSGRSLPWREASTSHEPAGQRISCRRLCVASDCAGRNRETWSPSRAGAFVAWAVVPAPAAPPQPAALPLPPRLWPLLLPPSPRPSRDSSVCICGPSRNDRARCAPVVHWSEQSLKECTVSGVHTSSYGPAITTVARSGSRRRRAAALASSSVTASSRPGRRTS
jgi:hypothetical protein